MRVEHTLSVVSHCPVDDCLDYYEVVFRLDRLVLVEDLLTATRAYKDRRVYQEDITQQLAHEFACEVETIGIHSGVRTKVICDASPVEHEAQSNTEIVREGIRRKRRASTDS